MSLQQETMKTLMRAKLFAQTVAVFFIEMQHVSSWTTHSLSTLMAEVGFNKIICTTETFRPKTFWGYMLKITDVIRKLPAGESYIYR